MSFLAAKKPKDFLYENIMRSWGRPSNSAWAWDPFPSPGRTYFPVGGGSGGGSNRPVGQSTVVSPVVISEQPSTIYPGSGPRGQISKEIDVPEGFYECVIQGVQRLCQEKPAGGWVDLPPVPEVFRDIIKTPVPVPVDDNAKENDMAFDWGNAFNAVIDVWQGQPVGGGGPPITNFGMGGGQTFPATPGPPPKVTVDTRTGKVTACRRKRQKKILTNANFDMLLRIGTLPRNENVRIALAKAL